MCESGHADDIWNGGFGVVDLFVAHGRGYLKKGTFKNVLWFGDVLGVRNGKRTRSFNSTHAVSLPRYVLRRVVCQRRIYTSFTNPTSMTLSNGTLKLCTLALVLSRSTMNAFSSSERAMFVPSLTRICSLPMI